jgi:hypothetical protein
MSEAPQQFDEAKPIEIGEGFALTGTAAEGDEQAEPKRRSPIRRVILLALLVIALAGLGTLGYAAWQIGTQKDATLSTPAQIGRWRLDTSEDGQQTADYLQTALDAEANLNKTAGAVYSDGEGGHALFFGGTATIWSPETQLDNAFDLISDKQDAVTGIHKIDAGHFGGTMKCGTTKEEDGTLAVCGWADHGCLALVMFPNQPESAVAPLIRNIRDATQQRH